MNEGQEQTCRVLEQALAGLGLAIERPREDAFVVVLPGEHKLSTTCALIVGPHSVSVNAFVARGPDENHTQVYRLLLQRNTRLMGMAFALDRLGDVYLVGRFPHTDITPEAVDRILGTVLETADAVFDRILAAGFGSSIRKEWQWRRRRGESTDNLDVFRHLLDLDADADTRLDNDLDHDAEPHPAP
jgi:hypothetical protein